MGQHGGHVVIFPSWVPQKTVVDIMWDDAELSDPRPRDRWDGELALLAGTFSTQGEWEWVADTRTLGLWVPVPGGEGHRRLVATLDQFAFPPNGRSGTGQVVPGIAPVAGSLDLAWQGDPL
ncbi:hypothetical protein AB0F46_13680 [Streptomyces sp. NPDC026665]|uniref:hypothetical protein n=1 Tax=Streptomyces sp. NPDC026665 TaxID=3154798 RepID=UPI00340C1C3B